MVRVGASGHVLLVPTPTNTGRLPSGGRHSLCVNEGERRRIREHQDWALAGYQAGRDGLAAGAPDVARAWARRLHQEAGRRLAGGCPSAWSAASCALFLASELAGRRPGQWVHYTLVSEIQARAWEARPLAFGS